MKFASLAVKVLFLMGLNGEAQAANSKKIVTIDVQKGSKSKMGGLLPSDIRTEVLDYQMSEYGHTTIEELSEKI